MPVDPSYEYPETYFPMPAEKHPPQTRSKAMQTSNHYNLQITDGFEAFWSLYPCKKSKEKARVQWIHDGCEEIAEQIIEKLKQQIARDKAFREGYVPNPHKYISEKRFQDEIFEGKRAHFNHNDLSWGDKKDIFDEL